MKNKIEKVNKPKTLKQIARENNKIIDKELDKEIAEKMINPNYFFDRDLQIGFMIELYNHNINHANSILTITSNFPAVGIEFRYNNKIINELSVIYVRLIHQKKFKHQTIFSASFHRINEKNPRSDEIELFINFNINHKLTETDIEKIDVKSQLEHQIQIQETKEIGCIFDKNNSMKIRFYKTGELNISSYVKTPLITNALGNVKNKDKYCFLWSILDSLHPCDNDHPNQVSTYIQYFSELNIDGFDFTNGFKCDDLQKFQKLYNNLSKNIFQLIFYQDKNKWKHN